MLLPPKEEGQKAQYLTVRAMRPAAFSSTLAKGDIHGNNVATVFNRALGGH
jgi:hypothetical protein